MGKFLKRTSFQAVVLIEDSTYFALTVKGGCAT